MPRGKGKDSTTHAKKRAIDRYEHTDKKRVNNPPVGLVNPETDPPLPTHKVYDYIDPVPSVKPGKDLDYDPHLDPQLVWAGKKEHSSFEVPTVSLHVHETIDPRTIIDAVRRRNGNGVPAQPSLFERPQEKLPLRDAIDFYKHSHGWSNRLIAGDSLLIMNSLLEKEGMAGQVQMVYIDPPYGIKYGSNFQPFVNKRDVKDGKDEDLTQEPEMIRAFRDTWELGIHSYLTYLRDRLLLAKELLHESGSCFVQISDENVHLVRSVMDDLFGESNFVSLIFVSKTSGFGQTITLSSVGDYLIWYARSREKCKYRQVYSDKDESSPQAKDYRYALLPSGEVRTLSNSEIAGAKQLPKGERRFSLTATTAQGGTESGGFPIKFNGKTFQISRDQHWKTSEPGMNRLIAASRIHARENSLRYIRFLDDFPAVPVTNNWIDVRWGFDAGEKRYVVETNPSIVARCVVMTTDPGDLVFDPTCGSGTTAYVAEEWGRRWITCDTSRVAVTLAKQRLMSAEFDYYDLAHPEEGVGSGFRYKTVPHVTLKSIANNPEIREGMSREQIDAAVARYADQETLYDQPYTDKSRVRVTGPFTVEAVPAPTVRSLDDIVVDAGKGTEKADSSPTSANRAAGFGMTGEKADPSHRIADAIRVRDDNAKEEQATGFGMRGEKADSSPPTPAKGAGAGFGMTTKGDEQQAIGDFRHAATPLLDASVIPNPAAGSAGVGEESAFSPASSSAFPALASVARKGPTLRHAEWRDELLKTGLRGKGGHHIDFARVEPLAGTRWLHADAETKGVKAERVVISFGPEYSLLDRNQVELAWEEARTLSPRPAILVFAAFEFDPDAAREIDGLTKEKTGMTFLTAQMNTDLLTEDLKKKRASNQGFWLVGRPDVELRKASKGEIESAHRGKAGERPEASHRLVIPNPAAGSAAVGEGSAFHPRDELYVAEVRGFDYYNTRTGTIDSGDTSKIAMWLLDTDYDGRSLYPRQVFFPMADDDEGWAKLARNLKAEIDSDLIEKYRGTVSLPFEAGPHKRIAVKVIDDRGIESLKVVNLK